MAKTQGKARGRPSSYKPEYATQAAKLAKLGATDQEIADFFEVSERTINRWRATFDDFCRSLKVSKESADERVERSLFARAVGYEHEEVDIRVIDKRVVLTPIRKRYAPDTVACIFWLKNRRPDLWREKPGEGPPPGDEEGLLRAIAEKLPG